MLKEYYKPADEEAGLETVSVAVMPCVAKKYEAARDEFKRNEVPDVDYVITTKELILMIKELGIQFDEIEPSAPDMPFSISSGAMLLTKTTKLCVKYSTLVFEAWKVQKLQKLKLQELHYAWVW